MLSYNNHFSYNMGKIRFRTLSDTREFHQSIYEKRLNTKTATFRHSEPRHSFCVTDGNIMYLTDASRSLISCVIQHYAPVVGWGVVEDQMHNVDYDPGPELETNIKIASDGDRTRVACVTGGHST
jgi:hypothetical protein